MLTTTIRQGFVVGGLTCAFLAFTAPLVNAATFPGTTGDINDATGFVDEFGNLITTNPSTTIFSINIVDDFTISGLTLNLSQIFHESVGQLSAILTKQGSGIFVDIFEQVFVEDPPSSGSFFTSTGDLDGSYQFNDAFPNLFATEAANADVSIGGFNAIVTPGKYAPKGLLSAFDGLSSAGLWTLAITDNEFAGEGELNAWSIEVEPVPEPTSAIGMLALGALGAMATRKGNNKKLS
jgi:PEP-CTERM motif